MAKLKVFTWSDGFHTYTVATTSRAKALAAWGVARDLFKDGDAIEITEGADHDAAVISPGETIKRGLSVDVGKVSRPALPKPPNKADLERIAVLRRELDDLRAEHDKAVAKLADRRKRLEQEAGEIDRAFEARSTALSKSLDVAKRKLGEV